MSLLLKIYFDKKNFRGNLGAIINQLNKILYLPPKKNPSTLRAPRDSHFSKESDIDHVPIDALGFCTYPIQFP